MKTDYNNVKGYQQLPPQYHQLFCEVVTTHSVAEPGIGIPVATHVSRNLDRGDFLVIEWSAGTVWFYRADGEWD